MPIRKQVFLHETDMFKKWMRDKGYEWPDTSWEQENMIAEFLWEKM